MTQYRWRKEDKPKGGWWYLLPDSTRSVCCIGSIATVYTLHARDGTKVRAFYFFHGSTGNKPESWMECGSVTKAKRWVEAELAKFWEPPEIVNI